MDERTAKRRWTPETTRKRVGYHGPGPEPAQEKVEAVHDLVADEQVAAQVATDLLRRPAMAFKAMTDDTARHQVNHTQVEQSRQLCEAHEQQLEGAEEPFEPTVRRINHALGFLDLVGACQRFVAATGRIVPSLRERRFSDDERDTVHRNVDRARATCERILTAVDTGQVDVDEELARLLQMFGFFACPLVLRGRLQPHTRPAATPDPSHDGHVTEPGGGGDRLPVRQGRGHRPALHVLPGAGGFGGSGADNPPAWLSHARRNMRDYETRPEHSEAMLTLASITLMTRRLTRPAVQPNASMPRSAEPVHAA